MRRIYRSIVVDLVAECTICGKIVCESMVGMTSETISDIMTKGKWEKRVIYAGPGPCIAIHGMTIKAIR
jgi:hypothetical protein